jgi:formate dehydrogenase subunit gamma
MSTESPSAKALPTSAEIAATVAHVLDECAHLEGPLLPILHGVQDQLGYIPAAAVKPIAEALNLSRAEVHGVITFYHHFRERPAGQCVVQVCRAESCRSVGGEELLAHAKAKLGCTGAHGASEDGSYSVEPVYCLGLCASSPAVMVGERLHARMNAAKLDKILEAQA